MRTNHSPPPRQAPRRQSPLGLLLNVASGLTASVMLSLVLGTFIEWLGMHWWWQEEGVQHSKAMVLEDLNYLRDYRQSLLTDDAVQFAASWALAASRPFELIGVYRFIAAQQQPPRAAGQSPVRRALQLSLHDSAKYLTAAIYVAQDAAIRLAIVVLALPAFAIAVLLGLIDGLGRRDIRKWSGGRESSFVYHHAKRLLWPAFTGGFTLYLTWPTGGFNPAWMVLPFCAALAWTMSLMAATFKKYL